jgi:predicted transcriptional regulator
MVKVTTTREKLINCFLEDIPLEEIMKRHGMTLKQINQLRKSKDFEKELQERRKTVLLETQDLSHIYIKEGQKALYQVMKTTKDERIRMEAARYLLRAVYENLDMMATIHTRYKIDEIKQQIELELRVDGE